ncbi:hypothetical protein OSB04_006992 [Centaurea solstitialis]|uniref:Uncharacterized protein n=1 Tax=Centaurea solstitialis TaxID=347529 RepID=A0AA38WI18_9ASTR|nr:hypothetical protein OSB04_006992 [Centaurea solstitialis]
MDREIDSSDAKMVDVDSSDGEEQIALVEEEMAMDEKEKSAGRKQEEGTSGSKEGNPRITRVPATTTTSEVPEHYQPKSPTYWDEEDKEMATLAPKCKRLLIMAFPNDIFMSLDRCVTSKKLWGELLKQLVG